MNPFILYNNRLLTATLTVNGTYSGYDKDNMLDYRPYTYWKAAAAGSNWIKGYWASAVAVDTVAICGHNLYSTGCTIYVDHSADNSNWTNVEDLVVTSDDAIVLSFNSVTKEYWRLRIENSVGVPYIGVLMFGSKLSFEYPPDAPLAPKTVKLMSEAAMSEGGNFLGANVKFNDVEIVHTFTDKVTSTWYSTYFEPFMAGHAELLKPFFYVWDLTNKPNDIYYCRLKPDNVRADIISRSDYIDTLTFSMIGRK